MNSAFHLLLALLLIHSSSSLKARPSSLLPSTKTKDPDPKKEKETNYKTIPPHWARILYTVTAINPAVAVVFNDYSKTLEPFRTAEKVPRLARTYETLFFFARLRPRVTFAIGAGLRALQLTTAIQHVFDPGVGVGFGLNAFCFFARSRWPATIVFGWAVSEGLWKVLGARKPAYTAVPISVELKEDSISREKPVPIRFSTW